MSLFECINTLKVRKRGEGSNDPVYLIAISPDEKYIYSVLADNTIRIWKLLSGKLINTIDLNSAMKGLPLYRFIFSPNCKYFIFLTHDSFVKIFDLQKGILFKTIKGYSLGVNELTCSPD
ncbi:MAG: WD40 repeat domain-containing protein, partial [Promethearchaeota archaeon]